MMPGINPPAITVTFFQIYGWAAARTPVTEPVTSTAAQPSVSSSDRV